MADANQDASSLPASSEAAAMAEFGKKMRLLAYELNDIFPEREHLVNQILYALVTREHVLVHGVFGTAKTDLVNAVFGAFEGPRPFSVALSKFMSEAHVIGIPDPKEMREEGVLRYQRDGGILDAHFAELDEFFDASAPLLRVLLGILHERKFKRGRQVEDASLHTAIASTNGDPETIVKNAPELGAVIDRFLLQCKVSYLSAKESRRKMYAKYACDRRPTVKIAYADLKAASDLVLGNRVTIGADVLAVHEEMVEAYRQAIAKTGHVISDRRACKVLTLARASAVMHGRMEVDIDDLAATRWGLCIGNHTAEHEAFRTAAEPTIEKARKARAHSIDELCLKLIAEYEAATPTLSKTASDDEVVQLYRKVTALSKQVDAVKPQLGSTEERKKKLAARLAELSQKLNARLSQQ